ncbi:MAG TPA: exodeoxyribonuclease VII small subunit [Candidatus Eisenbergiella intestinipullorum]|nr:exodeoxyribonuclease VII small subunit [Candidatus Eisenbergiella intestinipullorum]
MPAKKKTQEAAFDGDCSGTPVNGEAGGQKNAEEEISLEEAFEMLDEITGRLEEEGISLEESFRAYKRGMDLLKICNDKIDQVEKKVLVLNEEGGLDEF